MEKPKTLKSGSARQALAILAVDNIKVSALGRELLQRREEGLISYEQAKREILSRAKSKVVAAGKAKAKAKAK